MIFKHFIGVIKFKATGDNPLRFLNMLLEQNFSSKDVWSKNDEVFGEIYGKNYSKLCEIAEKNFMQISIVKRKGLIYKIIPYSKRIGIIAGIIFSIAIILFLSNTTLKIRVQGCDEKLTTSIMTILQSNGVEAGKFIPNMDFDQIERNILSSLNDVAWISIRNSGGIITVNVSQTTKKPDIIPQRLPCNIVSTKDARIINVQVYSGQLMTLIGNGVKKGDLLVSGFVVDKNGKATYYHALAKIIGEYEDDKEFSQQLNEDVKTTSDISKKRNYLNFFSVKIPMFFGKDIEGEYTYNEKTNNFSFFSMQLPIGITHTTYEQYEIKHKTYTKEQAKAMLDEQMKLYELNFFKNCTVVKKDIIENENENTVSYQVKYTVQGEITQTNEILLKK